MMVKKTTKALSAMFVALSAALLLTMSMSVVYATASIPVNGTWYTTIPGSAITEQAGKSDNYIVTISDYTQAWTGDISGTTSYDGRWITHVGNPTWVNSRGHYTIEATVFGKSGTLYIEGVTNSGNPQPSTWRIVGGTDELANLHGEGTFVGPVAGVYTYTGQVHFDP
jgi:hypothetical protein